MKKIFLIFSVVLGSLSVAQAQEVAVIANKSVTEAEVDAATLKNIFELSQNEWQNGNRIVFFDSKNDNAVKEKFYNFVGLNPIQIKKLWLKKQLTGEGKAPKSFDSDAEILNAVSSKSGALGYISAESVTDAVKVIAIIE